MYVYMYIYVCVCLVYILNIYIIYRTTIICIDPKTSIHVQFQYADEAIYIK